MSLASRRRSAREGPLQGVAPSRARVSPSRTGLTKEAEKPCARRRGSARRPLGVITARDVPANRMSVDTTRPTLTTPNLAAYPLGQLFGEMAGPSRRSPVIPFIGVRIS